MRKLNGLSAAVGIVFCGCGGISNIGGADATAGGGGSPGGVGNLAGGTNVVRGGANNAGGTAGLSGGGSTASNPIDITDCAEVKTVEWLPMLNESTCDGTPCSLSPIEIAPSSEAFLVFALARSSLDGTQLGLYRTEISASDDKPSYVRSPDLPKTANVGPAMWSGGRLSVSVSPPPPGNGVDVQSSWILDFRPAAPGVLSVLPEAPAYFASGADTLYVSNKDGLRRYSDAGVRTWQFNGAADAPLGISGGAVGLDGAGNVYWVFDRFTTASHVTTLIKFGATRNEPLWWLERPTGSFASQIAVADDGRVVLVSNHQEAGSPPLDFARYEADGNLHSQWSAFPESSSGPAFLAMDTTGTAFVSWRLGSLDPRYVLIEDDDNKAPCIFAELGDEEVSKLAVSSTSVAILGSRGVGFVER